MLAIIGKGTEWSILPITRELGKNGCKSIVIAFQDNVARYSKYNSRYYRIPNEIDKNFIRFIVTICKSHDIEGLVCVHEDLKEYVISNKNLLGGLRIVSPPLSSFIIAMDKDKTFDFVKNLKIPIPKTYKIKTYEDINKIKFNKKMVVKGIRGVSSENIRYCDNKRQLIESFKEISAKEKLENFSANLPLIQDYIGGPTYLTQGICQNGKVKGVVPHYKFREWPPSGGITCRAKTIESKRLLIYTSKIIEALNWDGEFGMEWKYDKKTDDYYFLEINPRFEGSVDIAVKSGVNLPKLLFDMMHGVEINDNLSYKSNTHYRLFFRNDFQSFLRDPQNFFRYLIDLLDPRVKGEITLDDINVFRFFWKKPLIDIKNHIQNVH